MDLYCEQKFVEEPMTQNPYSRLCLKPIAHADIFQNYKDQLNRFWKFEELDLSKDIHSWNQMNTEEQKFISMVLAFFANSDNAVLENIATRFRKEITWPEAQAAFAQQSAMEMIHVVTYNDMIEAVIEDQEERERLFKAVLNYPIIKEKLSWSKKWIGNPNVPLHVCFLAQTIFEGIFFAPNFAAILWLRKNGKCPGIGFGNEKIIEDESLHVKLFALLYRKCINQAPAHIIEEMVREAVAIEIRFIAEALPYKLKGMNARLMEQYLKKVADVVLCELGASPIYKVSNPFDWMENIGLIGKSNFFEKRVAEYQSVGTETDIKEKTFHHLGQDITF